MSLSDALTYRRCDAFNQLQLQYRACGVKGAGMLEWLRLRLRSLLRRGDVESELDEELRSHLEREIEQNIRHGMSRKEA